jgi:hypothetical protein
MAWTLFNIGVQLSAPRWVSGRSLAAYQAARSGGIAVGSWGWGHLTDAAGVETALLVSAALMLASPLIGLWLRMPRIGARGEETVVLDDPEVRLALTGRSAPVVVEIEYRVERENARAFHTVIQNVQLFGKRNGAYGWSIARDIADPELWTERYHCPTWFDYLRQRNRSTQSEHATERQALAFHIGPDRVRVRRMLERPFGSVRSKDDTPDRAAAEGRERAKARAVELGRKPILTPHQQKEAGKRLEAGETQRSVARSYNVSPISRPAYTPRRRLAFLVLI